MIPRLSDGPDTELNAEQIVNGWMLYLYNRIMQSEQRKLAKIGGKPCEWDAEQWALWNTKQEEE